MDEKCTHAAEQFLLKCLPKSANVDSFDSMRYSEYHSSKINIEKFPCCSSSLLNHIRRAFLETYKIKNCLINGYILDDLCHPIDYGYSLNIYGELVPIITGAVLPDDYPKPCTCGKCARKIACPCRVMDMRCTDFCKCKGDCRNPNK